MQLDEQTGYVTKPDTQSMFEKNNKENINTEWNYKDWLKPSSRSFNDAYTSLPSLRSGLWFTEKAHFFLQIYSVYYHGGGRGYSSSPALLPDHKRKHDEFEEQLSIEALRSEDEKKSGDVVEEEKEVLDSCAIDADSQEPKRARVDDKTQDELGR